MRLPSSRLLAVALVAAVVAAVQGGCGSGGSGSTFAPGQDDGGQGLDATTDGAGDDSTPILGDDGASSTTNFDVQPHGLQTITVTAGQSMPTVTFTATDNGAPAAVGWDVDRGNIGTVAAGPSSKGVLVPTGTTGGIVDVIASLGSKSVQRQVMVKIVGQQNGANPSAPGESGQTAGSVSQLGAGGGVGGVGGEGLGDPVTDPTTLGALQSPSSNGSAQGLKWLYPYDKTVWPRGMLAPLLMWTWSTNDADAIQIQLSTTSGSFSWTGTFARPPILKQTGGPFIRHPIPQDVWAMATDTAGGVVNNVADKLTVSLTIAKNGQGYGPITETWDVAPAHLEGTVYYNSYGTHLVQNSIEHSYNNGPQFGAAVLGIKAGALGPTVVAGTPSPVGSGAGCRVCHVVSSDGSTLIAQHGDVYTRTSRYDLKNGNAESVLTGYDGLFGWAGLSHDGTLALTNAADLAGGTPKSQLYAFPPTSTTPLAATGIPADLQAGTPDFSPDGKHVAFDFLGGTIGSTTGDGKHLVALDFDAKTLSFSNLRVLATMPASDPNKRAGFPSFFPTNDAVAFHYQIIASNHRYNTWHGAEAQIWWSDLASGTAANLYALNGLNAGGTSSYLPTGPNNHSDDTVLNYEPTVNPAASGGYIWVIFTSRRLYGNVATTDPWQSDPRNYDATLVANATCKKLWVAAIDLNAPPGSDPSHPAFYLPAQELLAGNARGFWVLDPCKADGASCQSGDQCCNGYCEPNGDGGALICSNMAPTCSSVGDKCTTAKDCCDSTDSCIDGFCAQSSPQ